MLREYKDLWIYRDLEMVEQLELGIPRILEYYDEDCFVLFPHFIRTILPIAKEEENEIKLHEVIPEKDLEETLRKLVDETISDPINWWIVNGAWCLVLWDW